MNAYILGKIEQKPDDSTFQENRVEWINGSLSIVNVCFKGYWSKKDLIEYELRTKPKELK